MRRKRQFGPGRIIFFIGVLSLVALSFSIYLQLELPNPTGPYSVGRTIFRWVDTSRPEVMTVNPNDHREVMVMVWYPAVQGTGTMAGYIPDLPSISTVLGDSGEVTPWQVFGLRWIRSDSNLEAVPLRLAAPYPVVVMLPGNGTNMELYASLAGEVASHGYVVVGVNHPYDVAAVELSDGTVAHYEKEQWSLDVAAHQAYIARRHTVKVEDTLFVMEQLKALVADASSSFAGILDLELIAVAGHSLGGIVASDVCKADLRVEACINFDGLQKGGPFSMETVVPPSQPFLFLTKEAQLHPQLIQAFETTSESYWVLVHGAAHTSFTDGPLLEPSLLPFPNRADRYMNLIQRYTLAFLDQELKNKTGELLSEAVEYKDVSVRVFPGR